MTHKTVTKPIKSNRQIREYLDAVNKGGRYVIPNGKSWYLLRPGNQKSSTFSTRREAITQAKQELTADKGDLFVFDKAGRLVSRQ